MRKIEFRGIAKEGPYEGKFVHGAYFYSERLRNPVIILENEIWVEVHPETVGQYVGVNYRDKKPAFDGDVFENKTKRFMIDGLGLNDDNDTHGFRMVDLETGYRHAIDFYKILYGVSVGNIHQNKELLR